MQKLNIKKLDGKSLDIATTDKEKLKIVFPQCFTEDKRDIDKLLSLCGEYIDNDYEKYKFEWKGKSECLRTALVRRERAYFGCFAIKLNDTMATKTG